MTSKPQHFTDEQKAALKQAHDDYWEKRGNVPPFASTLIRDAERILAEKARARAEDPSVAAIRDLYYSARWKSDRLTPDDERRKWEAVRDAFGFQPGQSPKQISSEPKAQPGVRVRVGDRVQCFEEGGAAYRWGYVKGKYGVGVSVILNDPDASAESAPGTRIYALENLRTLDGRPVLGVDVPEFTRAEFQKGLSEAWAIGKRSECFSAGNIIGDIMDAREKVAS